MDRKQIIGHATRAAADTIMDELGEHVAVLVIVRAEDGQYIMSNVPPANQVALMKAGVSSIEDDRQIMTRIAKAN
jgi:hypothetical protein